uniref:PMIS2 transmembrane protein n=1 Tax=Suricata suricatta TaxID=37032 RepID=A0A673VK35_SURSU
MPPKRAPPAKDAPLDKDVPPAKDAPPAGAPPAADAPQKPLEERQTPEELAFYAPNYMCLTILAVIVFPPLGLIAIFFSHKTQQANKNSEWEDAYINSSRTGWLDVFAILIGLGLIYAYTLLI